MTFQRTTQLLAAFGLVATMTACAHGAAGQAGRPSRGEAAVARQIEGSGRQAPRLDHLIPARDSQGSVPKLFQWTAVPGAESYTIGIFNEIEMVVWRQDNIQATSFDSSQSLRLEPGTYFWTISALRQGEEIAASGLSAFVIRPNNP